MIQDIGKDRFNNAYKAKKVTARDCMIVMWKDQLLIKEQGDQIQYPTWAELSPLIKEEQIIYLFSIDETGYYLVMAAEQLPIVSGSFVNLSDVRGKGGTLRYGYKHNIHNADAAHKERHGGNTDEHGGHHTNQLIQLINNSRLINQCEIVIRFKLFKEKIF